MSVVNENAGRMGFVDILRAIAAMSVVVQHVFELLSPRFNNFTQQYFSFGVFGVTVFFLISGFLIPLSLEKEKSLKIFWKRRFFRLYPLYSFSLVAALFLFKVLHLKFPPFNIVIINLTMLQKFLGQPMVLGVYWTLSAEVSFYIISSFFFKIKINKESIKILLVTIFITLLVAIFKGNGYRTMLDFVSMFVGVVFLRWVRKETSSKALMMVYVLSIILILIIGIVIKHQNKVPITNAFIIAYLLAYITFGIFVVMRNIFKMPYIGLYLGKISYSIYLMQALLLIIFEKTLMLDNLLIKGMIEIGVIIVVSSLSYSYIEKPFIEMGRVNKSLMR